MKSFRTLFSRRRFRLSDLKKLRVFISLLFFFLTAFLFLSLDPDSKFAVTLSEYILFFQFTPSTVKFFLLFTIASAGFIAVLILTLLFGRVYCSSICPLGTFQDVISFLGKKIDRRKYFTFLRPMDLLRYSILILTLLLTFAGSIILVNLLDPYSNFGKIFTQLIRPPLILLNNLSASVLESFNLYIINPVEFKGLEPVNLVYPIIFLAVVIWLSFFHGRLFCNTICPVGALLGFGSKFSLYKISARGESCRGCRLCERACKAGCIDRNSKEIDFTRCVGCYNCFTVCPKNNIRFVRRGTEKNKNDLVIDNGKRNFIKNSAAYFFSLAGLSMIQIIPKKESKIPVYRSNPVSPPGSKSLEHFKSACTACNLCVSACPSQVLQPSFLEYGFLGILQPVMDYSVSYCNYECTICTGICPTGAILPLSVEQKKLTQLGKAKFIKENCIVFTENTACGACSEHCPTKAVKMIPYVPENNPSLKNLTIPEVTEEYCTGCGACEHACPTKPYKSIYVEGNAVHLTAKNPPKEKIQHELEYQEDFPF